MAYLLERTSRTIIITASVVHDKGKTREIVIETRPEFAIVQLNGSKERYPLSWDKLREIIMKRISTWKHRLESLLQAAARGVWGEWILPTGR
jgi:hypothetical protein